MRIRKRFISSCVHWSPADVHCEGGLCDMINGGRTITRQTFCRQVDRDQRVAMEVAMGYPFPTTPRLTMARDLCVSYHSGMLHGRRVVWFTHSAIEYVFGETA